MKTKKNTYIKVLTYNISWESMTGAKSDWGLCSNNQDKNHPRHYSVCISNIGKAIHKNPTTFICLQEAANTNLLEKEVPRLKKMSSVHHESGLDKMVTYWDKKKFTLLESKKGEFENGRPYLALFFKENVCLVNVHFGHYTDKGEINKLNNMIKELGLDNYFKEGNRIIIAGDFNNDIKKLCIKKENKCVLNLKDIVFHVHSKRVRTCCIKRNTHFDHVIDTLSTPYEIGVPDVEYMASDHKPVIATLHR